MADVRSSMLGPIKGPRLAVMFSWVHKKYRQQFGCVVHSQGSYSADLHHHVLLVAFGCVVSALTSLAVAL